MERYSREEILNIVEEEDVEFIRLQFTDIFGILKNVAITASQLDKALNNDNVKRHIEGLEIVKVIVIKGRIVNIVAK